MLAIDDSRVEVQLVSNWRGVRRQGRHVHPGPRLLAFSPAVRSRSRLPGPRAPHPVKRHSITLTYKIGCDADGRIMAVKANIIGDKGAYASVGAKVLERAGGHCTGPYRVPNIDMEPARCSYEQPAQEARCAASVQTRPRSLLKVCSIVCREVRDRWLRHTRLQHPRARRSLRHRAGVLDKPSACVARSKR
ncbi:MAG: molybdopterin cofactor-binding domain-containing protein [Phycisphaerales bacterium]